MSTHRIRLVLQAQCCECGSMIRGQMPFGHHSDRWGDNSPFVEAECVRCDVKMKVPLQYLDCEIVPSANQSVDG